MAYGNFVLYLFRTLSDEDALFLKSTGKFI